MVLLKTIFVGVILKSSSFQGVVGLFLGLGGGGRGILAAVAAAGPTGAISLRGLVLRCRESTTDFLGASLTVQLDAEINGGF